MTKLAVSLADLLPLRGAKRSGGGGREGVRGAANWRLIAGTDQPPPDLPRLRRGRRFSSVLVAAAALAAVVQVAAAQPAAAACSRPKIQVAGAVDPAAIERFKAVREAAREGDYQAQRTLALLYRDGAGVQADRIRAYAWLNVAAARVPDAARERNALEPCLTAQERLEAEALSVKFLTRFALP